MYVDDSYERMLHKILGEGTDRSDRTGVGTRAIFGHELRYDLSRGFPLINTKFTSFRLVATELLWFLSGSSNVLPLQEQNCHIWDEWAKENGELGPVYGVQWRRWSGPDATSVDQIANVIDQIKNDPTSRRMLVSAWNVADLEKMALMPCHVMFQFFVDNKTLSCKVTQRSCDAVLGVPFNIASYALLTCMIATLTNLKPGTLIWSGGDVHVYANHIPIIKETRFIDREPYPFPTLSIVTQPESGDPKDFAMSDFVLTNYQCYPAIKFPIAV